MIKQTLDYEGALVQLEQDEKNERRGEAKELQEYYKGVKQDAMAGEQLVDDMTRLENEKQWKIKEQKWKSEEEARHQLM